MKNRVYKCSRCGRYPICRLERHGQEAVLVVKCNCQIQKHSTKDYTPGEAIRFWNDSQEKLRLSE